MKRSILSAAVVTVSLLATGCAGADIPQSAPVTVTKTAEPIVIHSEAPAPKPVVVTKTAEPVVVTKTAAPVTVTAAPVTVTAPPVVVTKTAPPVVVTKTAAPVKEALVEVDVPDQSGKHPGDRVLGPAYSFEDAEAMCDDNFDATDSFEGPYWEDCISAALTTWCLVEGLPETDPAYRPEIDDALNNCVPPKQ